LTLFAAPLNIPQQLVLDAPSLLRLLVGVVGLFILLRGAALYDVTLRASAFCMGAISTVGLLVALSTTGGLALPAEVAVLGGCVGGVMLLVIAVMAHRAALFGVGTVVGLTIAWGLGETVLTSAPVWVPAVGALVGGVVFPLFYAQFLKILTPAVGAVAIAYAIGDPSNSACLLGLWVVGVVAQVAVGGDAAVPEDEE